MVMKIETEKAYKIIDKYYGKIITKETERKIKRDIADASEESDIFTWI